MSEEPTGPGGASGDTIEFHIFRRNLRVVAGDSSAVFVDLLFAVVVLKILEAFARPGLLNQVTISALVLASVLTVTSWIGYRSSLHRPPLGLRFLNVPLILFLIHLALVSLYYFLVVQVTEYDGLRPRTQVAHLAAVELGVLLASFILYSLWETLAAVSLERARGVYLQRAIDVEAPIPQRILTTYIATIVRLVLLLTVKPDSDTGLTALGYGLAFLVVGYRYLKDCWERA